MNWPLVLAIFLLATLWSALLASSTYLERHTLIGVAFGFLLACATFPLVLIILN